MFPHISSYFSDISSLSPIDGWECTRGFPIVAVDPKLKSSRIWRHQQGGEGVYSRISNSDAGFEKKWGHREDMKHVKNSVEYEAKN